jgi:hypothetical protein
METIATLILLTPLLAIVVLCHMTPGKATDVM